MKTVRLINNEVIEIIPEYGKPVADWYGPEFAAQCREAPEYVMQHWRYDPESGSFLEPLPPPVDPDEPGDIWGELADAIRKGVNEVE